VRTEDLELAGEVVQDAAAYLGLTDLESIAHFPDHMQDFQAVLAKVSVCAAHTSPSPAAATTAAGRLMCSDGKAPTQHEQLCSVCCWTWLLHPCHAAVHCTSAGTVKEDFQGPVSCYLNARIAWLGIAVCGVVGYTSSAEYNHIDFHAATVTPCSMALSALMKPPLCAYQLPVAQNPRYRRQTPLPLQHVPHDACYGCC